MLIALFVNEWNERRKETAAFEETLTRVYTDVKKEQFQAERDFEEARLRDPALVPGESQCLGYAGNHGQRAESQDSRSLPRTPTAVQGCQRGRPRRVSRDRRHLG